MYNDKQLVRITVFILLVGIVLVYAVFFNTKQESLITQATHVVQSRFSTGDDASDEMMTGVATLTGDFPTGGDSAAILSDENTGNTVVFSGLHELFGNNSSEYLGTGMQVFPGTSLFQGNIDVLKTLGINYEYVLKDSTYSIYYVYIGRDKTYNLASIAEEFGGKTVDIYSQKDIINNLYFGDRVTFLELPQYKDVKVNVFITMGHDLWMIQDDASQYKAHKKYIRKLFTGK